MPTTESTENKHLSKLEAQLDLWNAKLHEVIAKANVAGQQAKIDSRKQLDELKVKLDGARAKLEEAKLAGREKWETLKVGVERAWHEIEAALKKVTH